MFESFGQLILSKLATVILPLVLMLVAVLVALGAVRVTESGEGLTWMAIMFGAAGILALVLACGLFALKSWAWPLGIAMVALSVVLALLSVISRGTLAWLVLTLAPAILLLGGLFMPDVRKALGRASAAK